LVLAQVEARDLRHGYIGTEHLLLGVARVADGVGARVIRRQGLDPDSVRAKVLRIVGEGPLGDQDAEALRSIGVDLDEVRRRVEEEFGPGALERAAWKRPRKLWLRSRRCAVEAATPGPIPFTPRAKKALELSLREALHLGHGYVGTEHILLGLAREEQGMAAKILARHGCTPDRLRRLVLDTLNSPGEASGPVAPSA
jgi:ATP-dependent Clp protease ATP-binding subunit ClpA